MLACIAEQSNYSSGFTIHLTLLCRRLPARPQASGTHWPRPPRRCWPPPPRPGAARCCWRAEGGGLGGQASARPGAPCLVDAIVDCRGCSVRNWQRGFGPTRDTLSLSLFLQSTLEIIILEVLNFHSVQCADVNKGTTALRCEGPWVGAREGQSRANKQTKGVLSRVGKERASSNQGSAARRARRSCSAPAASQPEPRAQSITAGRGQTAPHP